MKRKIFHTEQGRLIYKITKQHKGKFEVEIQLKTRLPDNGLFLLNKPAQIRWKLKHLKNSARRKFVFKHANQSAAESAAKILSGELKRRINKFMELPIK